MPNTSTGTILPVWTVTGKCLTEMYLGFDPKPHRVKVVRHTRPLWSSVTGPKLPKHGPAVPGKPKTRRPRATVKVRAAGHTIGVTYTVPVGKLTAIELGIGKVLIKYGE